MNKIVTCLLTALCLLALTACNRTPKRVTEAAEAFLTAYYTADYATAAESCTPALAAQVAKGAQAQAAVPEEVAEKMKEAVSQASFKIVSVAVDKEAGRAVVHYDLDVPMVERPVPKQLLLQLEGRAAAVDGIE